MEIVKSMAKPRIKKVPHLNNVKKRAADVALVWAGVILVITITITVRAWNPRVLVTGLASSLALGILGGPGGLRHSEEE
jgi:hypothetical protein